MDIGTELRTPVSNSALSNVMLSISTCFLWLFVFQSSTVPVVRGASDPECRNKAEIEQSCIILCALNTPNLQHLGWYCCPKADECRANWDWYRIGHIEEKTNVYVDQPDRFELEIDGTLTVKKVLPGDDGKLFICRGKIQYQGKVENTTILRITREPPKITTKSHQEFYAVEGMSFFLECPVRGFPCPRIAWIYNQTVLQNKTAKSTKADTNLARRSPTKSYSGNYTCFAENVLGTANYTVKVNVIDKPSPSSASPSDKPITSRVSPADNLNTDARSTCDCVGWKVAFGVIIVFLIASVVAVGVFLKLYLSTHGQNIHQPVNGAHNEGHCGDHEDCIARHDLGAVRAGVIPHRVGPDEL